MKPIRLLNLGAIPAWQTQAIYHALAERMDAGSQDTILICRPSEPYLCLGYHQVFESIFDPRECQARGLPVIRRRLGGGATYLDQNQIFYQCVFHHSRMPVLLKDIYAFALAAPVLTLRRLGLAAQLRDTNEIEVNGKRIAGTGGGRIGEATVIVGNLLLDFDFAAMATVWHTPSPAFRALAEKALRDHIVRLNELLEPPPIGRLTDLLIDSFSNLIGRPLLPGVLSPEELAAARFEATELTSSECLALHGNGSESEAMRNLKISARAAIRYDVAKVSGYEVHGSFWVAEDRIREAMLDSVPGRDWRSSQERLIGTPMEKWISRLESLLEEPGSFEEGGNWQ
ncbi:MAG TPA: biotin/lipoate A/B protein ligase family protein [Anaerolineaceae bacterium]|nr:biotin/lipoate A/B protein ligase family protein [Anaerolineaceae bacterium]